MFYFFHSKQLTTLNTHMLVLFQLLNTPSLSAQILFLFFNNNFLLLSF